MVRYLHGMVGGSYLKSMYQAIKDCNVILCWGIAMKNQGFIYKKQGRLGYILN